MGQRGLFDFSSKQQLTSWTILHNLYTTWLLSKLNLVSSRIASHAWRFITKKTKLKIHWPFVTDCVQISRKFKDRLLPSAIAFTADLRFSSLHINRAPKAVDVFTERIFVFHFFYPGVKNRKLCPFVTNNLLQILLTSQTFNYCWPLLKTTTGLPVDITWPLVADNGFVEGVAVSILTVSGYFVWLRTS